MRILLTAVIIAVSVQGSAATVDLSAVAAGSPQVMLLPVYHSYQLRPCQYYGFSFDDSYTELKQMREAGATTVATNRIWIPIRDPDAPSGDGYTLKDPQAAGIPLGQSFTAAQPFDSVAVHSPTYVCTGSGFTLALYRLDEAADRQEVCRKAFTDVRDNSWPALEFAARPAGKYVIEATEPTGSRIGLWAARGDVYADGQAFVSGEPVELDFALRIKYDGEADYADLIVIGDDKQAVELGLGLWDSLDKLGMHCSVAVGDWNNGLFPYYPDWYYEKYPDFCMLDQEGKRIEATMFDKPKGWPPIDHPRQIEGCARFTTATVSQLKGERIPMWVLGGEELYPTYCYPGRWADYQANAVTHFREWCRHEYEDDISDLNEAWRTDYASFEDIEAPKQPATDRRWVNWLDFRFRAMAERFVWLYQAVLRGDTSRLAITCNHGDIYHGLKATYMGMQPDVYASVSDGFETGQIMAGDDPWYFNLMYADTLNPLGKPVSPNRLAYKFPDPKARGGSRSYTSEKARRYSYESLGSGAWFLGLIQWRGSLPDGEWGMKGTPAVDELKKVFAELEELAPYLQHVYPVKPGLGVYVSHYTWALLGFDGAWRDLHTGLVERQVPKSFLYDASDWERYPVVLSINNPIVGRAAARKIRSYVERGGKFVVVGSFCEKNEALEPFAAPVFDGASQPTPVPGLGWAANLGKGMLIWIAHGPEAPLADRVVRLLDDLEIPCTTTVTSKDTLDREVELPAGAADLFAYDLHGLETLGQTFVAPHSLKAVRFSTPTFFSEVEEFSLHARVLIDGPGGRSIGEVTIPPEELSDNSWHAVPIPPEVAAGTRLYIEIESPDGLPESHLGVWMGKDDWYPDGQLYVDGQPMGGDMRFSLTYVETVPATSAIEAFTLTDGLNFIQVLVNTSGSPIRADVALDKTSVPSPASVYNVRDVVSGEYFGTRTGALVKYPIELPPHGTAAVVVMYAATQAEAEKALRETESAAARWQGLGKQYALTYCESARGALEHALHSKVVSLAAKALSALGISAFARTEGSDLVVTATVLDSAGKPVTDAVVEAAVTPAFGLTAGFEHVGNGKYRARITRESLPLMYDYSARQYVPLSGPVSIDITARRGVKSGAVRISSAL